MGKMDKEVGRVAKSEGEGTTAAFYSLISILR